MFQFKSRTLAAVLALGLPALAAAPASAVTVSGYGARSELIIPTAGYNHIIDGGQGSTDVSRSIALPSATDYYAAYGEASLGDGTIHSASFASSAPCDSAPGTCMGYGIMSHVAMWDMVGFRDVEGQPLQEITLIPTSVEIDGTLGGHYSFARYRSYFGYDSSIDPDTLPWMELSLTKTQIFDNLVVPLTTSPMFIYMELWTGAGVDGVLSTNSYADFGNTLHFNWELPEGVVAESASGVFMTELTSAVPEPASWALMIAGFGLVGSSIRRRNISLAA